jgi:hypothetical protein
MIDRPPADENIMVGLPFDSKPCVRYLHLCKVAISRWDENSLAARAAGSEPHVNQGGHDMLLVQGGYGWIPW